MNFLVDLYRETINRINSMLISLNDRYKDEDLKSDKAAILRYNQEIVKRINDRILNLAVFRGFSLRRAKELTVSYNQSTGMYDIGSAPMEKLFMEPERDSLGYVVRVWLPETYLEQMEKSDSFLAHYGIKGMKWGTRRPRGSDGRVVDSGKSGGSSKGAKKLSGRTTYQKTPDRLSDAELQRRIKRMELEKKYIDLNTPPPSEGKTYVKGLLENSGKTAVGAVVGGAASFAVQRVLKNKFNG